MGYTHYWKRRTSIRKRSWEKFTEYVKAIIQEAEGKLTSTAGNYYNSPVHIVADYSQLGTKPVVNEEVVSFNGCCESSDDDMSHETFVINRSEDKDNACDWFCKTARKPYDVVVVACLIAAKYFNIIASWSSDGDGADLVQGKELYVKVAAEFNKKEQKEKMVVIAECLNNDGYEQSFEQGILYKLFQKVRWDGMVDVEDRLGELVTVAEERFAIIA